MNKLDNPYRARGLKSVGFRSYLNIVIIILFLVIVAIILYAWQANAHKNKFDYDSAVLVQRQIPKDDAPVVVFETSKGTFKAVLYKEEAPNCVDYFINLVKDGYFNGTYVCEVQDSVYFIGGSKSQNGSETKDTDTTAIDQELTPNLWPFRGALMSYGPSGGSVTNKRIMSGSRVLFVNSVEFTDEFKKELDSVDGNKEIINAFKELGGVPNISQQYTTFGQVYDGFDVYDEISKAAVKDEKSLTPKEKITFTKVYMSTYGENKNDEFFVGDNKENSDSSESSGAEESAVNSESESTETSESSEE